MNEMKDIFRDIVRDNLIVISFIVSLVINLIFRLDIASGKYEIYQFFIDLVWLYVVYLIVKRIMKVNFD